MDTKRVSMSNGGAMAALFALFIGSIACSADEEIITGRESVTIRSTGGQSGSEGSCAIPPRSELGYDVQRAVDLVVGRHQTALDIRPWWLSKKSNETKYEAVPVVIDVALRGEPRVNLECGSRVFLDVRVTLEFQDPAIDIVFDGQVTALSETEAVLQVQLDAELDEHLDALKKATAYKKADAYEFILNFTSEGISGTISSMFGRTSCDVTSEAVPGTLSNLCGYSTCTIAAWPEHAHCLENFMYESDIDTPINGFSFQEALARLSELKPVPAYWLENNSRKWGGEPSTTLAISLLDTPQWLCVQWPSFGSNSYSAQTMEWTRVMLRVRTEDEKVNLELPASLNLTISNAGGWDGSFYAMVSALIPSAAIPDTEMHIGNDLTEQQLLHLNINVRTEGANAEATLYSYPVTLLSGIPQPEAPLDTNECLGCQLVCISDTPAEL
jgi:hypothetical protein